MLPTTPTCCLLTNSGRGAIAVVGLVGVDNEIAKINDRLFDPIGSRSFQNLIQRTDQVIFYGQWKSTAEDLVVVRTNYGLEIHCHGGDAASAAVIDDLSQVGCQSVTKQEWRRMQGNRWHAETEEAICAAATVRTANLLLRVLKNQFTLLSELSAHIEAKQVDAAIENIQQALAWADFGKNLTRPRSLVFCGQPNVGKSSLVNALAGFQRAIVNSEAGTTRDVLSQSTAIDGWPVNLKDTAGLRASQNQIETLGIEKAKQEIAKSQIRCLVFSCEDFQVSGNQKNQMLATHQRLLRELDPQLVIFNKSDLVPGFEIPEELGFSGPMMVVSALDKVGLQAMIDCIADTLVPQLPAEKQWFPVTTWQQTQLQLIMQQMNAGKLELAQTSLRLC